MAKDQTLTERNEKEGGSHGSGWCKFDPSLQVDRS